jgi:WD40 repeat protein
VEQRFLKGNLAQNTHFKFIQDYVLDDRVGLRKTLKTYGRVLQGKLVPRDEQSPAQTRLRLAGVVCVADNRLQPRNRLYAQVFNRPWVKEHMPSNVQRRMAWGVSTVLAAVLLWLLLVQPLFFPRFPALDKIVRYSPDPSVDIQLALNNTNMSRIALHRSDTGDTETLFETGKLPVLFQQETLRKRLGNLAVGVYQHTLTLYGGWPEQARQLLVEVVYYPNWEVRQLPDKRLAELNPIVEVEARTITFRDVMNGRELGTLKDFDAPITATALSADRTRLLVGSKNGRVRLWGVTLVDPSGVENRKVETKLLHTLTGHQEAVTALVFGSDRQIVVSGSRDHSLLLWNVQSGETLRRYTGHKGAVTAVVVSPEGRYVFSASEDSTVKQWNMLTGTEQHSLTGHTGPVTTLTLSRDGGTLVSGGVDKTLRVWDMRREKTVRVLEGHKSAVTQVALSADGQTLLSGAEDGAVKLWGLVEGKVRQEFQTEAAVAAAEFSAEGALVYVRKMQNGVKVWGGEKTQEIEVYMGHQGYIASHSLAFSPDGNRIASGGLDKVLKVWNLDMNRVLKTLQNNGEIWGIKFLPNRIELLAKDEHNIKLWDIKTGKLLYTFTGHRDLVWDVNISLDGKLAASASWDTTVKLWDIADGKELHTLNHSRRVLCVAFSPDGKIVASGGGGVDPIIKLWDVATGEEIRTLTGHTGAVEGLSFSPNGTTLISASNDNTLKLWDVTTGQELRTFNGHTRSISDVPSPPMAKPWFPPARTVQLHSGT